MGRPLNKRYFGDGEGALAVYDYRRAGSGQSAVLNNNQAGEGTDVYIVKQRGTNRFVLSNLPTDGNHGVSGGFTETMTLVTTLTTSGTLAEGQFRIQAIDDDGNERFVTKIYNRKVVMGPIVGNSSSTAVREPVEFRDADNRPHEQINLTGSITITKGSNTYLPISGNGGGGVTTTNLPEGSIISFAGISAANDSSGNVNGRQLRGKEFEVEHESNEIRLTLADGTAIGTGNVAGAGGFITATITVASGASIYIKGDEDKATIDTQEED